MNNEQIFEYQVELALLSIELAREIALRHTLPPTEHFDNEASKIRSDTIVRAASKASMAMASGKPPAAMPRYIGEEVRVPTEEDWVKRDNIIKRGNNGKKT